MTAARVLFVLLCLAACEDYPKCTAKQRAEHRDFMKQCLTHTQGQHCTGNAAYFMGCVP